ncbi:Versicolorin B synthase [Neofusicoccum parvum]|nr:Versicolorin B synthase [Neofusicoccum parvum]
MPSPSHPLFALALILSIAATEPVRQHAAPFKLTGTSFGIPGVDATYDYVVVGAGIAGSVVAARLAEDPTVSVAVVEAGGFYEFSNGNLSQIPFYSGRFVGDDGGDWAEGNRQPLVDWGVVTLPEQGLNGRRIHEAQGKCLGGGSARNQLIYHRGTVGAYAQWAELVGDDSYLYENMQQYFEKSVNFSTANFGKRAENTSVTFNPNSYSSSGGPLQVSYPSYAHPITSYGVRSTAESSFLAEAFETSTLKAYIQTQATKILFDAEKKATGVSVSTQGLQYTINARKEVILSAGAIFSPHLLMLSGIGPAATLQQHGIDILSDLPGVGQNMWNSAATGSVIYEVSLTTWQAMTDPTYAASQTDLYLKSGSGQLTNSGGDFFAWEKLPPASRSTLPPSSLAALSAFPADWPEVEYILSSSTKAPASVPAAANRSLASIGVALTAALSRGNVTLASADPADLPVVQLNFLLDETDRAVAVAAWRRAREAWRGVPDGVRLGREVFPGEDVVADEELVEMVRETARPVHHVAASCKMGKSDDPMAVVDSKARVFGVKGLRVVDASSFVFTPPGHTQGYTYAHAEKLADDIKNGQ